MSHPDQSSFKSLLLSAMPEEAYALLQPHLTRVGLERGLTLVPADTRVEHVYFPEDGIASITSNTPGETRTEVGIFGREGVSATFLLLGADQTPHESFMQVAGATALRIDTDF